jgi:HEAT repeat protein
MIDQTEIHLMAQSKVINERKGAINQLKMNFVFFPNKDQAWQDLHWLAQDDDSNVRWGAASTLGSAFRSIPDAHKDQAWQDLHRLMQDDNSYVRGNAASALGLAFRSIPDASKDQAWQDLHRLMQDDDSVVRWGAADALGSVFGSIPDAHKDQAWQDLIRLMQDNDIYMRKYAASALGSAFLSIPDAHKAQAWEDLHRLTQDDDSYVRKYAASALGSAFHSIPDASKDQALQDLLRLTQDDVSDVRGGAASALGSAFHSIPDASKDQIWQDLHQLTQGDHSDVRWGAASALGSAFRSIPDAHKDQAWQDLIRLTQDGDSDVRWGAASALGLAFRSIPDAHKDQAWQDLHRLIQDDKSYVRWGAASALGLAFRSIPDASKDQACQNLHQLTQDDKSYVRASANYSLGRISILKATEAVNENEFKYELKNALEFFEKSNTEASFINPARFCHPFYKSIFSIIFEERNVEVEVQEYIKEANNAIEGSESKQILLEAVENLENALREIHKSREKGLDAWKSDLKAYKRYCDRACNLLEITEKDAPGATKIIRRGLPIVDQRIEKILAEIYEKAEALCKQTRETPFEDLGKEVNQISHDLSFIRDPITLEKNINNLLIALSPICDKVSEKDTEACRFYEIAKQEPYIEDKLPLISMILVKFTSQINQSINISESIGRLDKKLDKMMVSIKPGISEQLVITVGAEFFGTGAQHVITIPIQEISYSDLENDLEKIKDKSMQNLTSLPKRLAGKIKDYVIQNTPI